MRELLNVPLACQNFLVKQHICQTLYTLFTQKLFSTVIDYTHVILSVRVVEVFYFVGLSFFDCAVSVCFSLCWPIGQRARDLVPHRGYTLLNQYNISYRLK